MRDGGEIQKEYPCRSGAAAPTEVLCFAKVNSVKGLGFLPSLDVENADPVSPK